MGHNHYCFDEGFTKIIIISILSIPKDRFLRFYQNVYSIYRDTFVYYKNHSNMSKNEGF